MFSVDAGGSGLVGQSRPRQDELDQVTVGVERVEDARSKPLVVLDQLDRAREHSDAVPHKSCVDRLEVVDANANVSDARQAGSRRGRPQWRHAYCRPWRLRERCSENAPLGIARWD